MLILPESAKKQMRDNHENAKAGLLSLFNAELEKVLNQYKDKDKYWVLGKVSFPDDSSQAQVFLEACMEKPPLVASSFLYEVDNRKGCKTLLWVLHPTNRLTFPTLGKTISVGSKKSRRKRVTNA